MPTTTTAVIPSVSAELLLTKPGIAINVLSSLLGKPIEYFCSKYNDHDLNHCAHFVSHALRLRIPHAKLCTNVGIFVHADRKTGYCIDVAQVFNACDNREFCDDEDPDTPCLVVATTTAVILGEDSPKLKTMNPKHVGIYVGGNVYNDSNSHNQVVAKTMTQFKAHYGSATVLLRADLPKS